jgi:hypothetical protein
MRKQMTTYIEQNGPIGLQIESYHNHCSVENHERSAHGQRGETCLLTGPVRFLQSLRQRGSPAALLKAIPSIQYFHQCSYSHCVLSKGLKALCVDCCSGIRYFASYFRCGTCRVQFWVHCSSLCSSMISQTPSNQATIICMLTTSNFTSAVIRLC